MCDMCLGDGERRGVMGRGDKWVGNKGKMKGSYLCIGVSEGVNMLRVLLKG